MIHRWPTLSCPPPTGPQIRWRPGRSDYDDKEELIPPDGRLPDAARDHKHIRDIFYRMGFNDQVGKVARREASLLIRSLLQWAMPKFAGGSVCAVDENYRSEGNRGRFRISLKPETTAPSLQRPLCSASITPRPLGNA